MVPKRRLKKVKVRKFEGDASSAQDDAVAAEEPLEIRLAGECRGTRFEESVSVTMRTPGDDFELAAGFLFTEGILQAPGEVKEITYCVGADKDKQQYNRLRVLLRPGVAFDPARLQRNFYMSSSCGICGKASLEAVRVAGCPTLPADRPRISPDVLHGLPAALRHAQAVFEKTGGLHAAALFDTQGNLKVMREDVGRHNAVDKAIGERFLAGNVPLGDLILLVSGRASFEIMQKAAMAGVAVLAAVGAPSSLAVELAEEFGMTLIGFLRDERFNVYAGAQRVDA